MCHLAGEFIAHLKRQQEDLKKGGVKISRQDEQCVRLAGLCHDLGKKHIGVGKKDSKLTATPLSLL